MSLEALSSLAAGLCQDVSVTLELTASTWAWAPERRTLLVPRDALDTLGIDGCAGIVAHEIGHALLSRYHLFAFGRGPNEQEPSGDADRADHALDTLGPLSASLLNALEDPRVELFMGRRYPGAVRWLELARAAHPHVEAPPIPTMALLLAIVRDGWVLGAWADGTLPPADYPDDLPVAVREALTATRAARARYIHLLPTSSLEPPPEAIVSYLAETQPLLAADVDRWPPRAPEAWVRLLAGRAALVCRDEIAPTVARLFKADVRALADAMAAEPGLEKAVRAALSEHGPRLRRLSPLVIGAFAERQAHASAGAPQAEHPGGAALVSLARRALFAVLAPPPSAPMGPPISLVGLASAGAEPSTAPAEPLPADAAAASAYQEDLTAVAGHVDELVRTLEDVLQRRRRLARRAGYVTGQRIDLRRAMAFVGSPRKPLDLWVRPSLPDRRSAAFVLLIDLSGSMRGPKIEHAMRGAVLFAETLARLQLPMAVFGFQDELVPAIGFGQTFDDDARGRLRSLACEVTGTRAGGHNRPGFNDDGPCLREAAAHLLDRSEDDLVLLVLSDGHPEGRRSNARDLHHAVSTLAPLLSLVGIGLGPGTEHVSDYYPRALASVDLESLPRALGGVLRQSLAQAA
jgi:hypothetical protein